LDENVERIHDFFHRGGEVPPMYVEKVDVRRAQLSERGFHGHVKVFGTVPRIVHHVIDLLPALVVGRVLGCNDELIADVTILGPLADKGL
jgi:hypothetical protein